MNKRGALLVGLGMAAAVTACGHPDQRVVDQYFNALRQGDTQTLTSFALVQLDQKVDSWKITGATRIRTWSEVVLPEMVTVYTTVT